MSVPVSQMYTVASYVLKQKLRGRKRYPFVLMLEPLFRCNLACAGCGKIQYPAQILKKHLTVEACLAAVEECYSGPSVCGLRLCAAAGVEPRRHCRVHPGRAVRARLLRRRGRGDALDRPGQPGFCF